MDQLTCTIERITYQNPENGYAVPKCRAKGYSDLITIVGTIPEPHIGTVLTVSGEWKVDGKYGRQFVVQKYEETLPATTYGIEKYIGSGLIKGVGPKIAKKIVQKFGAETIDVLDKAPDRLSEVEGLGKKMIERISKGWEEQKEIKNVMLFLQGHDVSASLAARIYKQYGNESIQVVEENPYRLADEVWGIGFRTADTIAEKMGFGHERYVRLRSGIIYTLNRLAEEGHCYADRKMLIEKGVELLGVEDNLLSMTLDEMIHVNDVVTDALPLPDGAIRNEKLDKAIYLPPFFHSEAGVAKRLKEIYFANDFVFDAVRKGRISIDTIVAKIFSKTGIAYDESQLEAIQKAMLHKVFVLTGGPGTGKTTTTLGIITALKEAGARILLAAPTGRAAKRLSEATGMEAKTIHRLLEAKPDSGYKKNEANPLVGDVLILDECSMIDIVLMYNLLKAVPDNMKLIMIGDADQLPSVGAGNVLRDIISSEQFPVVRLTHIFRQAQESRIITNAHAINRGEMPDISNGRNADFFFIRENDLGRMVENIVSLVRDKLPRYYGVRTDDIQALTPMQKGIVGAISLNMRLQEALNTGSIGLKRGGYEFRVNDKVMQIRNNYDKDVYNGDIGIVKRVDLDEKEITVDFEGRDVCYDYAELDELVLAYASTIHKAQGSEYPIVIIPITKNHHIMLQRNLIYTGITRAKRVCILIGEEDALRYAVNNVTVDGRNTMLKERIVGEMNE